MTRAKAAEVLATLASHSVGRAAVLEGGMVPTLASLVCVCVCLCGVYTVHTYIYTKVAVLEIFVALKVWCQSYASEEAA